MDNVFQFSNYRSYLRSKIGNSGVRSGAKSLASVAMGIHPAFLSRVMGGLADFSAEQTESLCKHFGLGSDEAKYFHLLVQFERAGTKDLKERIKSEIQSLKDERNHIKQRIPTAFEITNSDRAIYYSHWSYAAIHVLVSIPGLQSSEDLSRYLNLSLKQVRSEVEFLVSKGLVEQTNKILRMGKKHIHGGAELSFINQQHASFRNLAIQALDNTEKSDLHYSGVVSLSKSDAQMISDLLLSTLNEALKVVKTSSEEVAHILNLDFFNLSSARGKSKNL